MKSFTFFKSYYELIKNLPEEDGNKLMRGIMEYMFEGVEPEFDGMLGAIFDNIKFNKSLEQEVSE